MLSRPTIRHYTYSPFSLYALYVHAQKKASRNQSVRLKSVLFRPLNRLQPLIDIDDNLRICRISVLITAEAALPDGYLVQRR